jgi:transcriptional regulator with XRE-family HTH domain
LKEVDLMGTKYYPVIDVIATGKNILRLRKAQRYSVADLQEFLGFEAPQAIYKWQSGKSLPSTDNLFALSVFFEVSIEDILVAEKPKFQVVAQEESCDSDFLGLFSNIRAA